PVLIVDELEEQRSLTVPVQGEGKSSPLEQLALPSLPCGTLAPKGRVEEVLVIDQQALEQRDAGSNSTPALNFRERRVFVRTERHVVGAHVVEEGAHRAVRRNADSDRERVDEGADDPPVHGRTTGADDAKHDAGAVAVATQQHGPRRLDERSQGELMLAREVPQPRSDVLGDLLATLPVPAGCCSTRRRRREIERGRLSAVAHSCPPELLVPRAIPGRQRHHVIAKETRRGEFLVPSGTQDLVEVENFLQHDQL